MQPRLAYKDALFFSPHKLAGGVNTPGVLVIKKRLLANRVPTAPGGGTVFYVTDSAHRYALATRSRACQCPQASASSTLCLAGWGWSGWLTELGCVGRMYLLPAPALPPAVQVPLQP